MLVYEVCMWSGLLEANEWQGVVDAGVVSPCPRRFAAPYGAAIRPGQLVLLSAKDSVKAYMRGVDLGCDPASWFSVADASMASCVYVVRDCSDATGALEWSAQRVVSHATRGGSKTHPSAGPRSAPGR